MITGDIVKKYDGKQFFRFSDAECTLKRLGFNCDKRDFGFERWSKDGYELYVYYKNGSVIIEDPIHVFDVEED